MKRFAVGILSAVLVLGTSVCAFAGGVVKLELDQKTEPISKYIYGQFIEHLGRSVYGGLWAEMLEDRKFFFPVSDEYKPYATRRDEQWGAGPYEVLVASPWKVLGQPGLISMDAEHAYVGKSSPALQIPGSGAETGLSQPGLAIVKGMKYIGRIVLAADGPVGPVRVQLSLPDGQAIVQSIDEIAEQYKTYPLEFAATESADNVSFEIISTTGPGTLYIGAVSLMPADNIRGFRADVVKLLKELDSPIYRWPGGNFVSGYDWRHGIGADRDKRAPERNPAWAGVESNDVGIHEFMDLMNEIHSEPYIALNMGLGSVKDALDEVQYCVGGADTEMGKLRAANGHAQPWKVTYWAVGNEMFGRWQRGWMPQDQYIPKQNEAAAGIWKIDPNAKLVAVGEVGTWSKNMLAGSADFMNLISEHVYTKLKPDPVAHAVQLRDAIKRIADAHRQYRKDIPQLNGKDIRISLDEWNFWYGDYIFGELGCRYRLKDGLGVAMGLHEMFRNSDLFFMANYAQTVNVLGCIKASKTDSSLETTGQVLKMYRANFGTIPIPVAQVQGLDVSAAWTADRSAITVTIVNPTDKADQITVDVGSSAMSNSAKTWTVGGADIEAFNDPGKPPAVSIAEGNLTISNKTLPAPAQSAVIYRIELAGGR